MSKINHIPSQAIIQISLFSYESYSRLDIWKSFLVSIVVALAICSALYISVVVNTISAFLEMMLLIMVLVFGIRMNKYWFPISNDTLVIAFGELQLIQQSKILNYENLEQLTIKEQICSIQKISCLEIKGSTFPEIIVGLNANYIKRLSPNAPVKIDYLIFSKKDWTLLLHHLNQRKSMH